MVATRRPHSDDTDAVARYLDEIGRHPLLTAADERALAERIAAGRRATDRLAGSDGGGDPIPPSERRRLEMVAADGRRAAETFVSANLRLVVAVAKRYQATGVPLLDLVQEGNLGLLRAVEKFDADKGFRFSTYGMWWIRQFISRGIASSRSSVRLPTRANDDLQRLRRAADRRLAAGGQSMAALAAEASLPLERARELSPLLDEPVSLTATVRDGDAELVDFIEDPRAAAQIDDLAERLRPHEFAAVLAPLEERERRIVEMRHGIGGSEPLPVRAIADRLGLSRERVRQIERRALSKLAHPSRPAARWLAGEC